MTLDELQDKVFEIWSEIEGKEFDEYERYEFREFLNECIYEPETERVVHIEQDGGGEGGGEDCYAVIKVDGVFYKITYSYASYEGFNYDYANVSEVNPVQRLVTFYE